VRQQSKGFDIHLGCAKDRCLEAVFGVLAGFLGGEFENEAEASTRILSSILVVEFCIQRALPIYISEFSRQNPVCLFEFFPSHTGAVCVRIWLHAHQQNIYNLLHRVSGVCRLVRNH
jgi:hypothetical protein